jgi:hypothetical protein
MADDHVDSIHELTQQPIRLDLESAMLMNRETGDLTMASVLTVREYPDSPRKVGAVLWGPLSIPDNQDASWADLLRMLADTFDEAIDPNAETP